MGLIGAILGDIAGSRYEYCGDRPSKDDDYPLFHPKSYFTDDTVLAIAAYYAIQNKTDFATAYRIFARKYPDAGYGGSFYHWMQSDNSVPYNSCGNGSAMRVAYIGEIYKGPFAKKKTEKLATESALPTHNHPEGVKGAVVTAECIRMAEKGMSKDDILQYGISQYSSKMKDEDGFKLYKYTCDKSIADITANGAKIYQITCQDTVPLSIRCFYETESFEECCRLINSLEYTDADTMCAIAGAICDSYYGYCTDSDREILKSYLTEEFFTIISPLCEKKKKKIKNGEHRVTLVF